MEIPVERIQMEAPARPVLSRRAAIFSLAAALAMPGRAKVGTVDIGVCRSEISDFFKAADFGFDYLEPSAWVIAGLSNAAFAEFRKGVLASRIGCKVCNRLIWTNSLPRLRVVGPEINIGAIVDYLSSTLDRCREVGAQIVVWGSPASRKVPEGFSKDTAWQQMRSYLQRAGEVARARGMLFAIEPIRQQETNTLNTGAETLRMLQEVNHPNVKMILDDGHMRAEKEDYEIVRTAGDHLVHFHLSSPTGAWPNGSDENADYRRLFGFLKQVRFQGGISIGDSARGTFENDAAASLAFFRSQLG